MVDIRKIVMSKPAQRLRGAMPKVGIRPVIDGRRKGVRESLEEQTLKMAHEAARFLQENIRHSNGLLLDCVIPDRCIGGPSEAAESAGLFRREGVGASMTVTPCWCYGTEVMDDDPLTPKAVWGFNGTERPGAVYLAAALAGYSQTGLPAFSIYGKDVQDSDDTGIPEDVKQRLLNFTLAGLAVAEMRGKSYLSVGGVSMGIAGSVVDHDFFQDYLGMRVQTVDMTEILRRIEREIYDKKEYERALEWVNVNCKRGKDVDPAGQSIADDRIDSEWQTVVKMALIVRDLMIGNPRLEEIEFGEEALGHNALISGFQGQRQWTDHYPNGDFLEAILNSSFDWSGIREPFIIATENDSLNGVTMAFNHLLTGTAQIFADVRTSWSTDSIKRVTGKKLSGKASGGILHLINSGPAALDGTGGQQRNGMPVMKPFWEISPEDAARCIDAVTWCPAIREYFPGGGFSTSFLTKGEMPVTMARINLIKGLGPALQLAEGYAVNLPDEVHDILNKRTNPTWPTTWFVPNLTGKGPFRDVYSVMYHWGANHCAVSYGHIGGLLITLASMLRIPVYMHNVAEERIFRPSAWHAFGTSDLQSADFQACKNFGPLYG